jgi:hypothetical protein
MVEGGCVGLQEGAQPVSPVLLLDGGSSRALLARTPTAAINNEVGLTESEDLKL